MIVFILFVSVIIVTGLVTFFSRSSGFVSSWPDYLKYPAMVIVTSGVLLTCHALDNIQSSWQIKQWPIITATVIKSEVAGTRAFHPEITYRYEIANRNYESTTDLYIAGFGGKRSRRDTAAKIVADYPPGSQIRVHYNPRQPQESLLKSGPFWSDYMQFSLGITLASIGLIILFSRILRRFMPS